MKINGTIYPRNSWESYVAKQVNENHNTRISIEHAQGWPCALGVETKFSTTTHTNQAYAAMRLGIYLTSKGTLRVSKNV
ncbi:hypothetical protein [Legionella massiliensis]|uniref:hypothetical protein n=1 Tax=Legionella massiliensis TaxID=1034943 RepID=UPI0005C6BE59|nr:hypothetical protein [Legionella massiliensis]